MTINQMRKTCMELDARYNGKRWSEIYRNEEEIIEDLKRCSTSEPPMFTYTGYVYIIGFAKTVQNGGELTKKQLTQCKRLAKEIKKAVACSEN